jgi:hypothetical protein
MFAGAFRRAGVLPNDLVLIVPAARQVKTGTTDAAQKSGKRRSWHTLKKTMTKQLQSPPGSTALLREIKERVRTAQYTPPSESTRNSSSRPG